MAGKRGVGYRRAVVAILAALLLGTAVNGRADELSGTRRRLAEIEHRIQETAATAEAKRRKEQVLSADLRTLEEESRQLEAKVAQHQASLKELGDKITAETRHAADLQTSVAALAGQVGERLAALYKLSDGGLLRILFGTTSPAKLAENYDYFGRIVGRDRALIAAYRRQLQERQESLQQLAALRQREETTLAASRKERQTLAEAGVLKERLLAELRQERRQLDQELDDLRERARRLAALVKTLESAKSSEYSQKSGEFVAQQGQLRWPLDGPVEVPFGKTRHPELGTLRDSQGIEIGCDPGQSIRAVWGGRIIFANWFKGYGNLLIVDHGNSYYSLYAQAASLTKHVGETVATGDTLGQTGYEGTHRFYFEIRHSDTPLDPESWLVPRTNH